MSDFVSPHGKGASASHAAGIPPDTLDAVLSTLPDLRVQRIDLPGLGRFWLKRAETLSLRLRLQKGNPHRALEAERRGLHILGDLGLPVPELAAEGDDFLLIPDCGPNLLHVLHDNRLSDDDRVAAFAAAGRALGRLHRAGFAHGRPALRDICWDGRTARLIDLERFRRRRRVPRLAMAADVVMFVQSWFTAVPGLRAEPRAFLSAYARVSGADALERARRLARALGRVAPLARWLHRRRPRSRELAAAVLTLGWLGGDVPLP
ncbi:MAG: phosphotransferase [Paracoccaceae bacterium]|nr:MAG: phosphotransferase [Paracoccaceae bacterium]